MSGTRRQESGLASILSSLKTVCAPSRRVMVFSVFSGTGGGPDDRGFSSWGEGSGIAGGGITTVFAFLIIFGGIFLSESNVV